MAEQTETKPTVTPEADTAAPAAPLSPSAPSPPPAPTSDSTSPQPTDDSAPDTVDSPAPDAPPADPKVAQLRSLFPGVDLEVIEAVLASTSPPGNVDQAIQTLLEVNDPDFKPDSEELSQLELDEQLARELAREDELAQAHYRVNAPQRSSSMPASSQPQQPLAYQPYVPKSRRTQGSPASSSMGSWAPPAEQQSRDQQGQGQTRDELDELTEQFSKFAQQGKSMFGKFMTQAMQKGKEGIAKVDEAIQRSASPSSSQQPPAPPPKSEYDYASASDRAPAFHVPSPHRSASSSSFGAPSREKPHVERSQSPSPSRSVTPTASTAPSSSAAAASSTSTSAAAPASPAKPAFAIPGLLPRQSFSLLDQQPKKDGAASSPVKSPLGAPTSLGTSAAGEGKKAEGQSKDGKEKEHEEDQKSHYALGDDDSEDDMEYVKSPFDDD